MLHSVAAELPGVRNWEGRQLTGKMGVWRSAFVDGEGQC